MIEARGITGRVGNCLIGPITFTASTGAYCVLMGPSGCGKTTLLEMICGLRPHAGQLVINGRDMTEMPPQLRNIGYVPQDGALFPTMTVYEHLAFPLRLRRWNRTDIQQRVGALAASLHIEALLPRYPTYLSGGERQRVAIGRALAAAPTTLCLDEPISALDSMAREEICSLLRTLHHEMKTTILHVTHNIEEAEQLATQRLALQHTRCNDQEKTRPGIVSICCPARVWTE